VPLGIYVSVPFCRSKCSYCNFASDVVSLRQESGAVGSNPVRALYDRYVGKLCTDLSESRKIAESMGGGFENEVDSIYVGGGTPTLFEPAQLERVFETLRQTFEVQSNVEITVECAPGSLSSAVLDGLLRCGVNRVSLGVQSFVDEETRAVGRLHTRAAVLADIARLRAAGISNLNIDLIAGLPHQTAATWNDSLQETIAAGALHVSVYLLEIDEDSRLGRELLAGGTRYHAHFVPNEDLMADLYLQACETLLKAGISQYEISNFARPGWESRHNLKYWTRQPYLGFGLDAHSFLPASMHRVTQGKNRDNRAMAEDGAGGTASLENGADIVAVRFATKDSLEGYLAGAACERAPISLDAAREECFFLGLRLNRGVDLRSVAEQFGVPAGIRRVISELQEMELLECEQVGAVIRLTAKGRLLANEVFERFLGNSSPFPVRGSQWPIP
jgi:oxygen-independent coproporphyrinogen-3 oxidase